jgi:hypothetical protein
MPIPLRATRVAHRVTRRQQPVLTAAWPAPFPTGVALTADAVGSAGLPAVTPQVPA